MVNAVKSIKHGRGVYGHGGRDSSLSLGSFIGWLCLASTPAASSARFVCGGLTVLSLIKGPVCFFALFLFLTAASRCHSAKSPLQTNSRQMQTLYSINNQEGSFQGCNTSQGPGLRMTGSMRGREKKMTTVTELSKRCRGMEGLFKGKNKIASNSIFVVFQNKEIQSNCNGMKNSNLQLNFLIATTVVSIKALSFSKNHKRLG